MRQLKIKVFINFILNKTRQSNVDGVFSCLDYYKTDNVFYVKHFSIKQLNGDLELVNYWYQR